MLKALFFFISEEVGKGEVKCELEKKEFWILTIVVAISGLSQGLLLPLISIIFEEKGISSGINGFHATGIYLGVLLVSPFIELRCISMGLSRSFFLEVS